MARGSGTGAAFRRLGCVRLYERRRIECLPCCEQTGEDGVWEIHVA